MQAVRKSTPQKGRQGQLSFRSSQEERKGGLLLSLSQPADSKAAPKGQTQSTLQFRPVSREELAGLQSSQPSEATDRPAAARGPFRGFGSHSEEQRLQRQSGVSGIPTMLLWTFKVDASTQTMALHLHERLAMPKAIHLLVGHALQCGHCELLM